MEVSGLTLICAFRYALGRKSFVVEQIVNDILANWDKISSKSQFLEDIQIYMKLYGKNDDYDMQWQRILDMP